MLENEDGPLVRLELPEPTLHLVAVGDRGEPVGRTRGVGIVRQEPDDRAAPSLPTGLGDAGPHDQSIAPGVEPLGIAQPGQLVPDRDEGLLEGVLGKVMIAKDPKRDREEPPGRLADQGLERPVIARRGLLHQVSLHACRGCHLIEYEKARIAILQSSLDPVLSNVSAPGFEMGA